MRVLAVTHGPQVRPELFGEVISAEGHELVEWKMGVEPRPGGTFDAALVLGGHQNVGEEAEHPWLEDEYELLRELVAVETPLFAICLGAQALAHAFEAKVAKLPARQAGFREVWLTDQGARDPVVGVLPKRFEALVGNSYGFAVPDAGVELVSSELQPQGYRIGERAWAVQFHPEARRGQVLRWFEDDEVSLPVPLAEIERELEAKIDRWHRLGRALCLAFLATAGEGR
ncbi:MAG TPA: type 1 glutamine amidotransferase [Gaiellaceae bacterium]|jgi:GMP synthase-like glutamine amidotransferase|nr:type 1 glutamine amidotransferase [Gaiellaceae bacterium]